jgi:hypothetical protein
VTAVKIFANVDDGAVDDTDGEKDAPVSIATLFGAATELVSNDGAAKEKSVVIGATSM